MWTIRSPIQCSTMPKGNLRKDTLLPLGLWAWCTLFGLSVVLVLLVCLILCLAHQLHPCISIFVVPKSFVCSIIKCNQSNFKWFPTLETRFLYMQIQGSPQSPVTGESTSLMNIEHLQIGVHCILCQGLLAKLHNNFYDI